MLESSNTARSAAHNTDDQAMMQIRELLFGEQRRHHDREIAGMQARINELEQTLKALLEKRITEVTGLIGGLRDDMLAGNTAVADATDRLDAALRDLLSKTDERITLLDNDLQDSDARIRQTLTSQQATLDHMTQAQVERGRLAELLETVAGQLRAGPA